MNRLLLQDVELKDDEKGQCDLKETYIEGKIFHSAAQVTSLDIWISLEISIAKSKTGNCIKKQVGKSGRYPAKCAKTMAEVNPLDLHSLK